STHLQIANLTRVAYGLMYLRSFPACATFVRKIALARPPARPGFISLGRCGALVSLDPGSTPVALVGHPAFVRLVGCAGASSLRCIGFVRCPGSSGPSCLSLWTSRMLASRTWTRRAVRATSRTARVLRVTGRPAICGGLCLVLRGRCFWG